MTDMSSYTGLMRWIQTVKLTGLNKTGWITGSMDHPGKLKIWMVDTVKIIFFGEEDGGFWLEFDLLKNT